MRSLVKLVKIIKMRIIGWLIYKINKINKIIIMIIIWWLKVILLENKHNIFINLYIHRISKIIIIYLKIELIIFHLIIIKIIIILNYN